MYQQATIQMMGRAPVEELANQLLRQGRRLRVEARGSSTVPILLDGDLALVTPTAAKEILVGDVICSPA